MVTGQNLDVVQQPKMSILYETMVRRRRFSHVSARNIPLDSTMATVQCPPRMHGMSRIGWKNANGQQFTRTITSLAVYYSGQLTLLSLLVLFFLVQMHWTL